MQHILTTILRCDTDESFMLTEKQLKLCLLRLEQHNVDTKRLSLMVGKEKSLTHLVTKAYEIMGFKVKNPFRV